MLKRAQSISRALPPSDSDPQSNVDGEYAALEATLKSSEVGRRFLADYARQHPTPEVKLLLDAVVRLEKASHEPERQTHSHSFVTELVAMSETISQLRREIGNLNLSDEPGRDPLAAPCALEQILEASTRATSDVLVALEHIQSVSWTLREKGVAPAYCDRLDERAVDIYTACARREIAAQQTADAFHLLQDLEHRIDALIEEWSDHETQHLLDAARALDLSEAFASVTPARDAHRSDGGPADARLDEQVKLAEGPETRRTNRLVPPEDLVVPKGTATPQNMPEMPGPLFVGARPFDPPEPLTLETLYPAQRATLFG